MPTITTITELLATVNAKVIDVSRSVVDRATKAVLPLVPFSRFAVVTDEAGFASLRSMTGEVFTSAKGAEYALQVRLKGDTYIDAITQRNGVINKSHATLALQQYVDESAF